MTYILKINVGQKQAFLQLDNAINRIIPVFVLSVATYSL